MKRKRSGKPGRSFKRTAQPHKKNMPQRAMRGGIIL